MNDNITSDEEHKDHSISKSLHEYNTWDVIKKIKMNIAIMSSSPNDCVPPSRNHVNTPVNHETPPTKTTIDQSDVVH